MNNENQFSKDSTRDSSRTAQLMSSAREAIREGLKKAGDIIEQAGDKVEHAGLKGLGDWIERVGNTIEHLGEGSDEAKTETVSRMRNEKAEKPFVRTGT